LMTLGEADETPLPKARKSLDEIVSWERYSPKTT